MLEEGNSGVALIRGEAAGDDHRLRVTRVRCGGRYIEAQFKD